MAMRDCYWADGTEPDYDWVGDEDVKEFLEICKKEFRTPKQNNAIHKYCDQVAEALNDAGYDVGATIKVPVSFTKETVKDYMWKPVMRALFPDVESTTQLTTLQVTRVYEELNRLYAEKFGIHVPFPSKDEP